MVPTRNYSFYNCVCLSGCAESPWLCWLFSSYGDGGLLARCGAQTSHCGGFSGRGPQVLGTGSVVTAPGLGDSVACGIFPDPGSNLCLLHWQVDSLPLSQQGSPYTAKFYMYLNTLKKKKKNVENVALNRPWKAHSSQCELKQAGRAAPTLPRWERALATCARLQTAVKVLLQINWSQTEPGGSCVEPYNTGRFHPRGLASQLYCRLDPSASLLLRAE